MPFILFFIGVLLVVVGVRGETSTAAGLLQKEFTGAQSFIQWFLAIMILGLIGYYKPLKPVADGLLGLVILTMIIVNDNKAGGGGFFAQLEDAFQNSPKINPASSAGSATASAASASPTAGAVQSGSFGVSPSILTPSGNPFTFGSSADTGNTASAGAAAGSGSFDPFDFSAAESDFNAFAFGS